MINKTITRQPKSIVEIAVSVPWADIQPRWNDTVQKVGVEMELPGFRKGAAPLEMIEQQALSQVQQEFLRVTMPDVLIQSLQGSDVVPIDYPRYKDVTFQKGQDLKFVAQVTERPKVSVGTYKGITATKNAPKQITDEEVEKIIQDLFKRWKARRPAPATSTPASAPAGQAGSLSFNQPAAQTPVTPAAESETPDDEFAKAMGADSLTDLKSKIKLDLENEASYENELDYEEAILQEVEKITQVEVPDVLIQDELNRMLVSLQRRITDAGMLFDDYLKGQNKTIDSLKTEWQPQAEKNVRMELGLSEVARMENVTISDGELQAEIDKVTDARIKQQFDADEPKMHLRHALRQTKTLNLLKGLLTH